MHERNVSRNISNRYARTIRRYALFSRRLGPAQRSEHRRSAARTGPRARRRTGDRRGASTHQLCRARSTGGVGRRAARRGRPEAWRSGVRPVPDVDRAVCGARRALASRRRRDDCRSGGGPRAHRPVLPPQPAARVYRRPQRTSPSPGVGRDPADSDCRSRSAGSLPKSAQADRRRHSGRADRRWLPNCPARPRRWSRSRAAAPGSRKPRSGRTGFCWPNIASLRTTCGCDRASATSRRCRSSCSPTSPPA